MSVGCMLFTSHETVGKKAQMYVMYNNHTVSQKQNMGLVGDGKEEE